jgi:glycosyltransferase involved in cell wall biosynthesis
MPPRKIKPGFSLAKVYCDLFMLRDAARMVRQKPYDLIHAVEEASFIAMVLSRFFHIPYVFDMDSSVATQMLDRFRWLRPASSLLRWLEAVPMKRAIAIVPMCEDLAIQARRHCTGFVHVLKDVSLIEEAGADSGEDLRKELHIDGPMLLYVGNLETYQGIDLLLESFARLTKKQSAVNLVVIGGSNQDIDKYRRKSRELGIDDQTYFVGPRPVVDLGSYLRQADVLVSPRTQGTNTPMKIYSYLDSGVPVVATALPTHTQVMTRDEAVLSPVDAEEMAARISDLLDDSQERNRLAANAKCLIAREHSWTAFRENVDLIFNRLERRVEVSG